MSENVIYGSESAFSIEAALIFFPGHHKVLFSFIINAQSKVDGGRRAVSSPYTTFKCIS